VHSSIDPVTIYFGFDFSNICSSSIPLCAILLEMKCHVAALRALVFSICQFQRFTELFIHIPTQNIPLLFRKSPHMRGDHHFGARLAKSRSTVPAA
jgi:hypothetical protein